jgi:hypothetical protein
MRDCVRSVRAKLLTAESLIHISTSESLLTYRYSTNSDVKQDMIDGIRLWIHATKVV